MLDILGKRYIFFAISLLVIIPGLIILAIWGLPLAIDFTGGTTLEIKFNSGTAPATADMYTLLGEQGLTDVQVQTAGTDSLIIRASYIDENQLTPLISTMQQRFNDTITISNFQNVGPSIGQEVTSRAATAVIVSAVIVLFFIMFSFRGVPHAFRYGICAIIAMIHDVAVVFSITAIGGKFFGWQADSLYLTALLTVIGFSVQDTIVVFDRIRENTNILKRIPFEKMVNHSIVQTLQRSINTQLMTVEFMLLALALFGGATLREFSIIMLVGLFMGSYSSIFIAAPTLVVWENKEWRTWFGGRKKGTELTGR